MRHSPLSLLIPFLLGFVVTLFLGSLNQPGGNPLQRQVTNYADQEQEVAIEWVTSVSGQENANGLSIVGDTNRDGDVSTSDVSGHQRWSWNNGAFMLANVDDDDQDGLPDWQDEVVNGEQDAQDLAPLSVTLPESLRQEGNQIFLRVGDRARSFVNVFQFLPDQSQRVDITGETPLQGQPDALDLRIEAKNFAHQNWNGLAEIEIIVRDQNGYSIATDQTILRVAPWLMLPNSAQATDVYVSSGVYENQMMRSQLQHYTQHLGATLHDYQTDRWEEMWMQDTMEIGYQEIPGHPRMHVVLQANRDADRFPPTLLAPNVGYITIGEPRHLTGDDHLADWLGNLEVSHPVPGFPLGRIYYGRNVDTDVTLQPEIVKFLEMQVVQSPVWVDTSWLRIKHVDEIFNFVPGSSGDAYLIVNSPRLGAMQVQQLQTLGADGLEIGYPPLSVSWAADFVDPNQRLQQEKINSIIAKAKQDFNLADDHIIQLPILYSGDRDAYGLWSNPVNSIYVNGAVIAGAPQAPSINEQDYIERTIQQQLGAIGIPVVFVDDRAYQENHGNVHCATNAKRQPIVSESWKAFPTYADLPVF